MPAGLSKADQDLWRECARQHDHYEVTKKDVAAQSVVVNTLLQAILLVPLRSRDYTALCDAIDELIKIIKRLTRERLDYVEAGCDAFDWFSRGTTAAQREAAHRVALAQLQQQMVNLLEMQKLYCAG